MFKQTFILIVAPKI